MDYATHTLAQAAEGVWDYGRDGGIIDAAGFLDTLNPNDPDDDGNMADGINDSVITVGNLVQQTARDVDWKIDVVFPLGPLLAAADAIREDGFAQGVADAVEELRRWHDDEVIPGAGDDPNWFYIAGVRQSIAALFEQFDFEDPDPDWVPAEIEGQQ